MVLLVRHACWSLILASWRKNENKRIAAVVAKKYVLNSVVAVLFLRWSWRHLPDGLLML